MSNFHFSSKVLNFIDTRPKDNEVKGAVELDPQLGEYLQFSNCADSIRSAIKTASRAVNPTTYATFDKQGQPLSDFIAKLCAQLGIANSADTSSLFCEQLALIFDNRRCFVTEINKGTINQGFILILTASPENYAQYFLKKLNACHSLNAGQLSLFGSLCLDSAFAEAFDSLQGIQRLTSVIEEEMVDRHSKFDIRNGCSSSVLLGLLHTLLQLMQLFSQLFPWTYLSTQFVRKIAFFVNGQAKLEQNDTRALALEMLLALTEHCEHLHESLKAEVPVDSLIRHLDNTDNRVMLGSLSLINAIYALADREERINIVKLLHERPFIAAIERVLAREAKTLSNGRPPPSTANTSTTSTNNNTSTLTSTTRAAKTNTNSIAPPPPLSPALQTLEKAQIWDQLANLQNIRFDEVRALAFRIPTDTEVDFLKSLSECCGMNLKTLERGKVLDDDEKEERGVASTEQEKQKQLLKGAAGEEEEEEKEEEEWGTLKQMVRNTPPGLLSIRTIFDIVQPPSSSSSSSSSSPLNQSHEQAMLLSNLAWNKLQELDAHFLHRPCILPQILVHLTAMLLRVLGIGEEGSNNSSVIQRFGLSRVPRFWRLVLKSERPFYELFRVLVEQFCRTWREMNAKPNEMDKVYSVVQEQFERALLEDSDSVEQLEREMLHKRFSYFNMQKIWKREQLEQEQLEMNSEDIQPLRDHLRPEFEQLAVRRRIALLKKGMTFQRVLPVKPTKEPNQNSPLVLPSSSSVHSSPVHSSYHLNANQQPQYWFWRLDDRERFFNFWDCRMSGGKHAELVLDTQGKLEVADIRAFFFGQELAERLSQQHGMKQNKKSQNILRCGICLEAQSEAEFLLCAQNEKEFGEWLEALNCLCWPQKALQGAGIRAEVDRLLNLQVNIRLMHVPKLSQKPTVPEVPTDFRWIIPCP